MTVFNITSENFWGQPRLSLTLVLCLYLLGIVLAAYALRVAVPRITARLHAGPSGQSVKGVTAVIRIMRILASAAGAIAIVISVRGLGDVGFGVFGLFIGWPLAVAQIILGFLPWEKYTQANDDKFALFISYLVVAGAVDYGLYLTAAR
jgi:hypothetical protein